MEQIKHWLRNNTLTVTGFWIWTIISVLWSHYLLTQVTMIIALFLVTVWDWYSGTQVARKYNLFVSKRAWDSWVKFGNNFMLVCWILMWEFIITFLYWKELEWWISIWTIGWFKYHLISWATIWWFLIKELISLTENYEKLWNVIAWIIAQKLRIFHKTFMDDIIQKIGIWDKKLLPLKLQLNTITKDYIERIEEPSYKACAKITTNFIINMINEVYNMDDLIIKRDLCFLLNSTRKTVESQILNQRLPFEIAWRFMRWYDRAINTFKVSLSATTDTDYKYQVIWLLIKVMMDWLDGISDREKYDNIPLELKYQYDTDNKNLLK